MKKIIITIVVCLAASLSADAQFFWGMQFGLYSDGSSIRYEDADYVDRGGTSFNYSIKPKIGYYFTPKLVAGAKLIYTKNSFAVGDNSSKATTIWNYALNMLMGNGLDANCMTFRISPYIRYNLLGICNDKVKIWMELNCYLGGKYSIDSETHKTVSGSGSTTYGVLLHPVISVDLANRWMLFTSLDAFSLGWDGTTKKSTTYVDGVETTVSTSTGAFLFQFNPVLAVANCFTSIGVIRKF